MANPDNPQNPPNPEQPKPAEKSALYSEAELEARKRLLEAQWNRSQATQAQQAKKERKTSAQQAEGVYKQLGVESPREREQAKEQAIQRVLEDGGFRVTMAVDSSVSQDGTSGYQDLANRVVDESNYRIGCADVRGQIEASLLTHEDLMHNRRLDDVMKAKAIHEVVDIRTKGTRPIYQTVPGKKGFMGIGKTPDQRVEAGREDILHSDLVKGGKREPAARIAYMVTSLGDKIWKEHSSGRYGQEMVLQMIVPQSTADEVKRLLEKDPTLIRRMAERVMKGKLLKNPQAWDLANAQGTTIGPPYSQWEKQPDGTRLVVQVESENGDFTKKVHHLKK